VDFQSLLFMPPIKALRVDLIAYAKKRSLLKKLRKQIGIFEQNPKHPSLNTEALEPRKLKIYSFRIDKRYRAIFIYIDGEVEIIDINLHYQ